MAIDKIALKKAERAILEILGNLIDLPYHISNTVCNIYYRYFELFPEESIDEIKDHLGLFDDLLFENADNPFIVARMNIDSLEDTKKSGSFDSVIAAEFICITKLISALRNFRDHPLLANDSIYFFMMLDLIPDIFKYKINRAFDKTPIRRKIERKFKEKKVNEIFRLADFMEVRIDEEDD